MLPVVTTGCLRRHRKLLAWTGGSLAVLLAALTATGCLMYRHMSNNIAQVNLEGYIGKQPADLHPQAENILIIGSGSARVAAAGAAGASDQPGTLMLAHIAGDKQWAEVMSIPPDSLGSIPSSATADSYLSAPAQSKVNQAYATGNQGGKHVALGVAYTIKALERYTGIYINHFIVMNSSGFKGMVAALGGVEERNLTTIDNPRAGLVLTPAQALAYAHGLLGPGGSSGQARTTLQGALAASLIARARSDLSNPLATYRFLDAFTRSLTIDSQLGGITGLYHLAQVLHGMPAGKIAYFALPSYPRAGVVLSDTTDVPWAQPADSEIFASFRNDVQVSHAILAAADRPGKSGVFVRPRRRRRSPGDPRGSGDAAEAPQGPAFPWPGPAFPAERSRCPRRRGDSGDRRGDRHRRADRGLLLPLVHGWPRPGEPGAQADRQDSGEFPRLPDAAGAAGGGLRRSRACGIRQAAARRAARGAGPWHGGSRPAGHGRLGAERRGRA